MKNITFCLPEECLPNDACRNAWEEGQVFPPIEYTTCHNWIYQTWNFLKESGFPCNLSTEICDSGITIALGLTLDASFRRGAQLPKDVFFVDVVADKLPHPAAQLHLVQNKTHAKLLPNSLFVPHWPQPHLIPRDPTRNNRFENIFFFGHPGNLAPELSSKNWRQRLQRELGLSFYIQGNMGWHDYRHADAVLAIRNFSRSRYFHKPATKLYNAWQAGVPFIAGRDSAYALDGHSGKDYLIATSPEEVFQHLKHLKEDENSRNSLIQKGFQSGASFSREATLIHWKKLLQETLPRLADQWQQTSMRRRRYFSLMQRSACLLERHFIKR